MKFTRQSIGLLVGALGFVSILLISALSGNQSSAINVFAIAVLMASWWVTEAIPIPATSLLPIVLFPLLGIMKTNEITLSYGNHYVFLFLGGFFIAVTVERWNLHKRIALYTIAWVGSKPSQIVLGFMLASAFLSMWISNIATTMMMVTIAQAVLKQLHSEHQNFQDQAYGFFSTALMLGIAYASSIGGVSTLVGTAPNVIFAGVFEHHFGYSISFTQWFMLGFPLAVIMLMLTWCYLSFYCFPIRHLKLKESEQTIQNELRQLGQMSYEEKMTLSIFILVALMWMMRGFFDFLIFDWVKDSTIAVAGALLLFLIPTKKQGGALLDWKTAVKIPWDILLLFGGGFALAKGFDQSGLTEQLAQRLEMLDGAPEFLVILVVTALVIFLTEITSNTATASLFIPIMLSLGVAMQIPVESLMLSACIAASFAFMLPVATPPNAIVFSTRCIQIQDMARVGFGLNLLGVILISGFIYFIRPLLW